MARATKPLTPALRKLTTPLTPMDYAGLFDPLRGREVRGRIMAVSRGGGYTTLTISPGPLLEALTEAIPDIHTETFHAQGAASGNAGASPDPADLGGDIEFGDTGVVTTSTGSTTILDAAENCGISLVHGCRMGICRTCVTPITDGTAVDLRDGATYGPGEQIRTCCSVPSGYLHIAGS